MKLDINITPCDKCQVFVQDNSEYLPETFTGTVKNKFRYSDTVSIDVLKLNKTTGAEYLKPVFTKHEISSNKEYSILHLTEDIDLKGTTYIIPENTILSAEGGMFMNGTVVGTNTVIRGNQALFHKVTIDGAWKVPEIYASMFDDLSYDNALLDVFALTNNCVHNTVYLDLDTYYASIDKSGKSAFDNIASNTEIYGNLATVIMRPNDFSHYAIFHIKNKKNIFLAYLNIDCLDGVTKTDSSGKTVTGEWGFGIHVDDSNNVHIEFCTIQGCYGDAVYIGNSNSGSPSVNVCVNNCSLNNCRRLGISVTNALHVYIQDNKIYHIKGTNPQKGIDIEPNKGCVAEDILIRRNHIYDCFGGILVTGAYKNSVVDGIKIINNNIEDSYSPESMITLDVANNVVIDGNVTRCSKKYSANFMWLFRHAVNVDVRNNIIDIFNSDPFVIKDTRSGYPESVINFESTNTII